MFDWDDLRYFLAVHRGRNLAVAAGRLKINATTVGRRLTALEEQLGARLFDRTPDGFQLTPAGSELLPRAERMELEALALAREVSGADARLSGIVRLSATEMLATRFIAPQLSLFRARYPDLTLEVSCTPRNVNLGRREADIALRLARPREEYLVTKKLAEIPLGLYASQAYVARHGLPADAEVSLNGHAILMFADARAFTVENDWLDARLDGAKIVLRSDSVSSIFSSVLAGVGIGLVPCAVAEAEHSLVRVRTRSAPEPRVVWQTMHRDLAKSPRVRAVAEFLEELLTSEPSRVAL